MNISAGDLVRAKHTLFEDGEDLPPLPVCCAGDTLEVRRIGGGTRPITVAHQGRKPNEGFCVTESEIEPLRA